ncbi:hypothetical protein [Helicobacter winghamensis]|uniref:hypothetical protein n=1 Tax=Helicobacter winghamensis TaxID=157268 RepID=UPI0018A67DCC|nr:hypothetical protein [Helicobacter winghamensis]QOQ98127.1 hypothetical protein A0Z60_00500 [Helicobacter winghamensis]
MSYKKYLFLSFIIPLPFIFAYMILAYIYDPLQIYHKPYFRETTFSSDMRRQALGIIKHYDFNSYILGSSMLENTSAKEASEKLGGKWVNISLSGSRFNERALFLKYIFSHKIPKEMIYSLDGGILVNSLIRDTHSFDYLYDNNPLNDLKAYFDIDFFKCTIVFSKKEKCIGKIQNIHDITRWINYEENKRKFGGFENLIKYNQHTKEQYTIDNLELYKKNIPIPQKIIDISQQKEHIQQYLLPFIKENQNTNFHLIIPTYSRLFYRKKEELGYFQNNSIYFYTWKEVLIWLIKETSNYKNVTFYGFDTLDYADNIANYKDSTHYNIDMNSLQLSAIQNKTHILTLDNMESYFDTLEQKIQDYDITPLIDKANATLP